MKRQATEWEEIFAYHISDKGLNIYNMWRTPVAWQLKKKQNKKPDKQIKKWAKDLSGHSSKEYIQWQIHEKMLIIISHWERKSQPHWDTISHPLGVATINTTGNNKSRWKCREIRTLYHIGWNVKRCICCGKQYDSSSKNLKMNYCMTQQCYLWIYTQKNWEQDLKEIILPPHS